MVLLGNYVNYCKQVIIDGAEDKPLRGLGYQ